MSQEAGEEDQGGVPLHGKSALEKDASAPRKRKSVRRRRERSEED